MNEKRTLGIIFIGYFYIFLSILLLITLGNEHKILFNKIFLVPTLSENVIRILIIIFSLIVSYGYLKMKKWGYWSMVLLSSMLLLASLNQIRLYNIVPFSGTALFTLTILFYTFIKRNYYFKKLSLICYIE